MTIQENYQIGQNIIAEDGFSLGQYVKDKKQFIIKDVDFFKKSMLSTDAYSMAKHKELENKTYSIYGKRKIYNEVFGSIDQFLVKRNDDLEWKELPESDYQFIDLDY